MGGDAELLTILAMGMVTYMPRLMPLQLLASRKLPQPVEAWLKLVPVAVLAALVLPSVPLPVASQGAESDSLFLWASVATVLVAWRTRSLLGSVAVGVGTVALARLASTLY
jgi:branched-subunit amino acid transport protein